MKQNLLLNLNNLLHNRMIILQLEQSELQRKLAILQNRTEFQDICPKNENMVNYIITAELKVINTKNHYIIKSFKTRSSQRFTGDYATYTQYTHPLRNHVTLSCFQLGIKTCSVWLHSETLCDHTKLDCFRKQPVQSYQDEAVCSPIRVLIYTMMSRQKPIFVFQI